MGGSSARCGVEFVTGEGANDNCCYRPVWEDRDRCVWHADATEAKPIAELLAVRETEANRELNASQGQPAELLDEARVPEVAFPGGSDFDSVFFRNGDFTRSSLAESSCQHAVFAGAELAKSEFRNAELEDFDARLSNCQGADFRSAELRNADFFDADLTAAYFAQANAPNVDFRNIDAAKVSAHGLMFDQALLTEATMRAWDLKGSSAVDVEGSDVMLSAARMDQATFEEATLIDSTLSEVSATECEFTDANLSGIDATDADFQQATFDGANLMGATLSGVNLAVASMVDSYLVEATVTDGHLVDIELTNSDLIGARLDAVNLANAECSGTTFEMADLKGSNLREATFDEATLADADLTDVSLQMASLRGANIERAIFSRADLFGADLRNARTYGAVFAQTRINDATQLGDRCIYDPNSEGTISDMESVDRLTRAAEAYQELEKLCRENALSDKQSHYFVRRQDINLEKYRRAGDTAGIARARAARTVLLYGESPFRVIGTAASIILVAALVYPVFGVVSADGQTLIRYSAESGVSAQEFISSLYFSALTFTTGFSGFQPLGLGRLIATLETLSGAVLLALLVFVFSRRATR